MSKRKETHILDIGLTDYSDCWVFQKELLKLRAEGLVRDSLILTEHNPVITMGRGTDRANLVANEAVLKAKGVSVYEIERGGDITFHGPGQLVAYPIIDLKRRNRDTHKYLRDLEKVIINSLNKLGLVAGLKKGLTGVWVNDSKVAAIGVGVSKWITYHGLALNVNTDLDYFHLINPCGITEYPVSSISSLINDRQDFEYVKNILKSEFLDYFEYNISPHGNNIDILINNYITVNHNYTASI